MQVLEVVSATILTVCTYILYLPIWYLTVQFTRSMLLSVYADRFTQTLLVILLRLRIFYFFFPITTIHNNLPNTEVVSDKIPEPSIFNGSNIYIYIYV